jgi:hypothetical protein
LKLNEIELEPSRTLEFIPLPPEIIYYEIWKPSNSRLPKMVKNRFNHLGIHGSGWKPDKTGLEPPRTLEFIPLPIEIS